MFAYPFQFVKWRYGLLIKSFHWWRHLQRLSQIFALEIPSLTILFFFKILSLFCHAFSQESSRKSYVICTQALVYHAVNISVFWWKKFKRTKINGDFLLWNIYKSNSLIQANCLKNLNWGTKWSQLSSPAFFVFKIFSGRAPGPHPAARRYRRGNLHLIN